MSKLNFTKEQDRELKDLYDAVIEGDEKKCAVLAQNCLDAGVPPLAVIDECLTYAIREVGEMFNRLEIFLPEMMENADAMQAAIDVLEPHFESGAKREKGTVVLATVKGDIHDIGKNIFGTLLKVNGYDVHDLGRDISPSAFVDTAEETNADIIAMSGLLSTSLPIMKDVVELLNQDGIRNKHKVIIGGGPTSTDFAKRIGADGYSDTAYEGIELCETLLDK